MPSALHHRDDAIDRRARQRPARPRRSRSRGRPRGRAGRRRARCPAPSRRIVAPRPRPAARAFGARVVASATKRCTSFRAVRRAHAERAVLADDGVDRPHARDVVAPAGRPAGDRDDELAGRAQALQRRIGRRRQLAWVVSVSSMSVNTVWMPAATPAHIWLRGRTRLWLRRSQRGCTHPQSVRPRKTGRPRGCLGTPAAGGERARCGRTSAAAAGASRAS